MSKFPYKEIVVKAIKDERFRASLIKSPEETLSQHFTGPFPKVEVVADTRKLFHIVVPMKANQRGKEAGKIKAFLTHLRANPNNFKAFQRDPHGTLNKHLGYAAPKTLEFRVLAETEQIRIVHLPAVGAENVSNAAEAEAFWGGGGGGGGDWTVTGALSDDICPCYTPEMDVASDFPRCCFAGGGGYDDWERVQTPGGF